MAGRTKLRDRALTRAVLLGFRRVSERYTGLPLPDYDEFAQAARVESYPARATVPNGANDVLIVIRGLVKSVNRATGRLDEFFGMGMALAPNLRPAWGAFTGPPLSTSRWRKRPWSIPGADVTTLVPTVVLRLDYRVAQSLAARHPQWGQVQAAFLWTYIDGLFAGLLERDNKDIATRYLELARRRGITKYATQREIASYLNVTEFTLSRVVRRLNSGGGDAASDISPAEEPIFDPLATMFGEVPHPAPATDNRAAPATQPDARSPE